MKLIGRKNKVEIIKEVNQHSDADYDSLFNTVKNYESRIKEIEGSNFWKLYLFFTKAKLVLTSDSYLKSDRWRFFQRIRFLFSGLGLFLIGKFFKQLFSMLFGKVNRIVGLGKGYEEFNYDTYKERVFPRDSDFESMAENMSYFRIKPALDVLVFVDSKNFKYLNTFLNALEDQLYKDFTVKFLVDKPTDMINYTLEKIATNDSKFEIIQYSGILDEKFVSDKDFLLITKLHCIPAKHCFYAFVENINQNPKTDFIYADNDFYANRNTTQSENPYFKPDWSPYTLLSRNYIGDMFMVANGLFMKTQLPFQNNIYSLVLNLTHAAKKITHVQHVLYHQFVKPIDSEKVKKNHQSLNRFLMGNYPKSYAKLSETALGCFRPVFKLNNEPLVSIIIPAKNKASILETCLESLLEKSSYQNFEIIVIDNGSSEKSFFSTVAQFEFNYPTKVKCHTIDIPFNYSILNNEAAKHAKGEYLLFLNNDTQLISPDLIKELLKLATQENAGAVGPKLLYPNNTIQHAGIVLSLDETGAHVYSGAHKDTSGYFNNTNCLTNYSAVTGACMMISKEKFEFVGGFDENLAVDCNDVELCCRLIKSGFYNIYVPWVSMYHYECLTRGNPMLSARSMVRQNNEKNYFLKKFGDMIKNDPFYNKNLTRISKNFELKHV